MRIVKCNELDEHGSYWPSTCSECRSGPHEHLVETGEETQWDSATVYLCRDCLKKALDLFAEGK